MLLHIGFKLKKYCTLQNEVTDIYSLTEELFSVEPESGIDDKSLDSRNLGYERKSD